VVRLPVKRISEIGSRQVTRIAASSHHDLSQPNPVAFLNAGSQLVGEHSHPGHLVFFPRSCISIGQRYTRARELRVTRERLVVDVAEGLSEAETPGFLYELDYKLNVAKVTPNSVKVGELHDHSFSRDELDRLKAGVIVRRD
jgi:hypothetical protein